jgi:diaminopimelate decarboxylase
MAHIAHDPNATPDNLKFPQLKAILPQTAELKGSHLFVGGVDMVELARTQGTALYVYDEEQIRANLREYVTQLAANGLSAEVAYAGKAFTCKAMVKLVLSEGASLDVSSGGELAIALAAGFDAARVVVHGNNKTPAELNEAISAGAGRIVADCSEELLRISRIAGELGRVQNVLLRITPGVEADTHAYCVTASEDSKFGFGIKSGAARAAVELALSLPNIKLAGLHMHIGSQIFALESFGKAIEVMCDFMSELRDELSFIATDFDLGGGLGVAYSTSDEATSIAALASYIAGELKANFARVALPLPHILVEPGRSIVANAGITLYTVGSVKNLPDIRTFVAVDGGMTDNIRTALYDAHYDAIIANRADEPRSELVTVCGKHCESGDVVAIDASIQPCEPDDILAILATGAYCQSMASNYNRQVRPGVVFVKDGQARLVCRRETYDDLMGVDLG